MKKLISFLLASVISISAFAVVSVSADTELDTVITETVQPRYAYVNSTSTDLYISNGKATCTSIIKGMPTVTKIVATQYLEKKVLWWWEEVDHWDKTVNGDYLYMCNSKNNLDDGATYRVRTVATVYSGTDYEIVEDTSK